MQLPPINLVILKWLIKHKANLDWTMSTGNSALLMAISLGEQEMIKLLIENGANVNQKGTLNKEMDKALRKQIENLNVKVVDNVYFNTTEHIPMNYYNHILYSLLNSHKLLSIMKNAILGVGVPPLLILMLNQILHKKFSEEEFNSLLTLLISKGVDLNMQDDTTGATALIFTALAGHTDTMKLLLDNDADPLMKDKEGMTALDLMKSDKTANAPEREEKIQLLETAMKSAVVKTMADKQKK